MVLASSWDARRVCRYIGRVRAMANLLNEQGQQPFGPKPKTCPPPADHPTPRSKLPAAACATASQVAPGEGNEDENVGGSNAAFTTPSAPHKRNSINIRRLRSGSVQKKNENT